MDKLRRVVFDVERTQTAADEAQGIFEVMISTGGTVRGWMPSRAIPEGAILEPYLKNPVVMWAHDYRQPPIGRTLDLVTLPSVGIKARFQFSAKGDNPQADLIHRLWATRFLNAASIGFAPIDSTTELHDGKEVEVFTKWELYEFSIVSIPADRDALRLAVRALGFADAERNESEAANEDMIATRSVKPKSVDVDLRVFSEYLKVVKEVLQ